MKAFHAVTGLPRSGSTLFQNILSQNPKFYASSTSNLCQIVSGISQVWSTSLEIKAALDRDREGTEKRLESSLRAFINAWYPKGKVVFDKGRGWSHNALLFAKLYPQSKMLVVVRDLRAVFGSIEKQHRKQPVLDTSSNPLEKTMYQRANEMFSPQGMIGSCVNGVEDMLRREPALKDNVIIVQFEQLAKSPKLVMERVYSELGEEYYAHDYENVENVSEDQGVYDSMMLNKYPHSGEGKVEAPQDNWQEYCSNDIAELVMQKFQGYNKAFGYS